MPESGWAGWTERLPQVSTQLVTNGVVTLRGYVWRRMPGRLQPVSQAGKIRTGSRAVILRS